ncbi:MAG: GrpB family protein [Elusimicrobia bacterium]|nr:GrpB family protein [Elusimicrobiota bacterium]
MTTVHFEPEKIFRARVRQVLGEERKRIHAVLPGVDIQHIGSTAIPNSITKGDLDIQVRVGPRDFEVAYKWLLGFYELNRGNPKTRTFASFKNDSAKVPLGVQLTVIGGREDKFVQQRDFLLNNLEYRKKYLSLKRKFEGKSVATYRRAKGIFFDSLI